MEFLRLRRTGEGWAQDVQSTELRPIFRADLATALAAAGLTGVMFYGGYQSLFVGYDRSPTPAAVSAAVTAPSPFSAPQRACARTTVA